MFSWFKTPELLAEEGEKDDETTMTVLDDETTTTSTTIEAKKRNDPTTITDDDQEEEIDPIRSDIRNALRNSSDAWNSGDLETYLDLYSKTARYTSESLAKPVALPEDLILRGKDAISEVFTDVFRRAQKFQEKSNNKAAESSSSSSSSKGVAGLLEYSNLEGTLLGAGDDDDEPPRNALVFGKYRMELSDTVIDTGVFTLHMVLEDDDDNDDKKKTWRIQSEHSSAAPKK